MALHATIEKAFQAGKPVDWAMLGDPAVLESMSAPVFQVFINICDEWELSIPQRLKLLGGIIAESTYHNWKSGKSFRLNVALMERISLVLGIYKALKLIFVNEIKAHEWMKAGNAEPVFGATSPMAFMLHGPVENLYRTRKYLDAWRGIV